MSCDVPTVLWYAHFRYSEPAYIVESSLFVSLSQSFWVKKERKGLCMRNFKTSEKKRGTYIYFEANGNRVELIPGQDGVNESWIALLHALDDEEVDAYRREMYHCPVSYDNSYNLVNKKDPLEIMLALCTAEERYVMIEKVKKALLELTDKQYETVQKKFYLEMSNVDIASDENVTETAIRNRCKKIYNQLKKKI